MSSTMISNTTNKCFTVSSSCIALQRTTESSSNKSGNNMRRIQRQQRQSSQTMILCQRLVMAVVALISLFHTALMSKVTGFIHPVSSTSTYTTNHKFAVATTTTTTTTTKTSRPASLLLPLAAVNINGDAAPSSYTGPQRVVVAGATGRTGRLVVEQLLKMDGIQEVTALVRNVDKANELFDSSKLSITSCDFGNEKELTKAIINSNCDAVIWCATGFSDSSENSILNKLKQLFTQAVTPKQSIDSVGIPAIAKALNENSSSGNLPRLVMLSSAGTTRPSWSEEKKSKLVGCADIPIVRLNPFGILDVKRESEEALRQTGVPYCIVRPCGLNDSQPINQRPILSQGDVAVGRINRMDVAKVLVDVLSEPAATGKTFEVFTLKGFPPNVDGIGGALSKLRPDTEPLSDQEVQLTYSIMQQLLPGETQDAAALAMGQTYEQLDKQEVGRLGIRGEENAEAAAPKPSS